MWHVQSICSRRSWKHVADDLIADPNPSRSDDVTLEEKACNYDTFRHIERVRNLLNLMARELLYRGELHDQSKLASPEVEMFTEFTPKLAASTYGSAEYEAFRKAMGPALAHHYANNRHHPEHFKDGRTTQRRQHPQVDREERGSVRPEPAAGADPREHGRDVR